MFDREFSDFKPLEGETFTLVLGPDAELPFVLAGVVARRPHAAPPAGAKFRSQPFSLFFECRLPFLCPQDNYRLRHPALEGPIHLVPVGVLEGGGFRYQAVFT